MAVDSEANMEGSPARFEHTPQTISLDGAWDFAYTPTLEDRPPMVPETECFSATIKVPGYWDEQIDVFEKAPWADDVQMNPDYEPVRFPMPEELPPDASLPHVSGVGWYKTSIDVPEAWRGGSIVLNVGGAVIESFVYVNGVFIRRHLGNSTPFAVDLTKHLRYGESNELVIAVSNLDRSIFGLSVRGYHGYTGGIFRSVSLHVAGAGVIDGLFLRPIRTTGKVRWWADLRSVHGTGGEGGQLRWCIRSLDGERIDEGTVALRPFAKRETMRVEWETSAEQLDEWSPTHPRRYVAEILWEKDGALSDRREQSFGLRTLERRGRGLELNGRPIMLRGVCDHYYFAPYANAPIDIDYYRRLISTIKEVGYNFIRCHTWVPPAEYLQAADELGMLVQVELANGEEIDALRRIVRHCRVHPSVVIYCGGNENLCDEPMLAFFEDMYDEAKALDPGCLIMPQQAMRGIEYYFREEDRGLQTVDEPFRHDPRRLERIHHSTDVFGQYSWGYLSYKSLRGDWRKLEKRFAVYRRPILSHEVGISGCYVNLDLEDRYTDRIPPDLYTGVRKGLEKAGRLHMAERYYKASSMWQSLLRKHMFETLRLCPSVNGYDHLGAWNSHWHRTGYDCGPFNEFFELKHGVTKESLLQVNGESVVLLDHSQKRSYWCGDNLVGDFYVSLYGGEHMTGGVLRWRLTAGEVLWHEDELTVDAPDGTVTRVGRIDVQLPVVDRAQKATLTVEVSRGEEILTNEWDFWVFPKVKGDGFTATVDADAQDMLRDRFAHVVPDSEPSSRTSDGPSHTDMEATDLRIVGSLTATDIEHLQNGGKLLLLGSGPFPARETSFQIAVSGRTHQDLAVLVNDHPVLENIPHDGFGDWQFRSLIEGGHAVVFNDLDVPFDPIVEVVSSYKHMRWQALMWEAQTEGGGRLFVASCHFNTDDPAAVTLIDSIVTYMRSDRFRPQHKLSLAEVVTPMLGKGIRVEADRGTDMALDPNVERARRRRR